MKATAVALVGRAGAVRVQLANYLRESGFEVSECDELPGRCAGAVVIDDDLPPQAHERVATWLRGSPRRVVVVSSRPAGWRECELSEPARVRVLAAPAFGWQIVDALRGLKPSG